MKSKPVETLLGMERVGKSLAGRQRFPNDEHRWYVVFLVLAGD